MCLTYLRHAADSIRKWHFLLTFKRKREYTFWKVWMFLSLIKCFILEYDENRPPMNMFTLDRQKGDWSVFSISFVVRVPIFFNTNIMYAFYVQNVTCNLFCHFHLHAIVLYYISWLMISCICLSRNKYSVPICSDLLTSFYCFKWWNKCTVFALTRSVKLITFGIYFLIFFKIFI